MLATKVLVCALLELGSPNYLAKKIAPSIIKEAKRRDIPVSLISAVIKNESRFHPKVVSWSHDYGLMQIHCPYAKYAWWCKRPKRLMSSAFNIKIGTRILQLKRKRCKKKKDWLSCYNPYSKGYANRVRKIERRMKIFISRCKIPKL